MTVLIKNGGIKDGKGRTGPSALGKSTPHDPKGSRFLIKIDEYILYK